MARSSSFQVRVLGDTTKFDAAMSKAQRELREFGNVASKAFSIIGVASFAAAFKSAAENIANFEKANSELAAVLGTTKQGVEGLANSAKQLGTQTKYSASEVTQLQIALSRLGFDSGQIEAMQGAVLNFATAMDTDLASAADFTGSALRAFGLQAQDTSAMLDVLSASTTNSALDFTKLQTSISVVAPIAKSFGLDVKETAALLGVLSNNGFDASSAATALRNILLNLADTNGKLSKGIGHSVTNFDELIEAFQELDRKGVDVASVLEMTDKRSAAAAITIIKQADAVADLKVQLDGAEGSLDQMAETMQDNLIGAVTSLKSAWEGFTLTLSQSAGPLKSVVDGLTEMLRALSGSDKLGVAISEGQDFAKSLAANQLAATLTNGGTLNKKQQKQYDALVAEGYIQQNGFRELGRGQDAEGYFKTIQRSNEFGFWGDEQRVAMTDTEIEAYKASLESATEAANNFVDSTKKGKTALQLLQEQARKAAEEVTEINAADAELAESGNALYEQWRALQGFDQHSPFNNEELLMYAQSLKAVVDYEKELSDVSEMLATNQDNINAKLTSSINRAEDLARVLAEELGRAIESGLLGAFDALANAIGGVTDGGFDNVAKALIEPLADMAIRVGTIIMLSGEAIEALKASLVAFFGGSAILAGGALVAVGIAAKAGLAGLAQGNYSASSYVASGSYTTGSGDYETRDVNLHVTGKLEADGDSLVAVINNTNNRNGYTT